MYFFLMWQLKDIMKYLENLSKTLSRIFPKIAFSFFLCECMCVCVLSLTE